MIELIDRAVDIGLEAQKGTRESYVLNFTIVLLELNQNMPNRTLFES